MGKKTRIYANRYESPRIFVTLFWFRADSLFYARGFAFIGIPKYRALS